MAEKDKPQATEQKTSQSSSLLLCICYSHLDEGYIDEFRKHITPLKDNGLIKDWYDRKIIGGQDFQNEIDNNLENADIICLFMSANFLSSDACKKEIKNALELKKKKGIVVLPVILSPCGWLDVKEISSLLALPTDGGPVSGFADSTDAWNKVYNGLKDVIEKEIKIKRLKITEPFLFFLQDTNLLTRAHSRKDEVLLDDIFVYPELEKYDDLRECEKKESSEKLIENFCEYPRILIAGENQAGKTTLCKKIFVELRKKNFVPVYISDKANQYAGKIENKISKAYKEQYEIVSIDEIDKQRLVPILDDFHFAKNKGKHINDLSSYYHQIIIVDDIFSLNFKDESLIRSFSHFKIKEFVPSLRDKLINKWACLSDTNLNENEMYQNLDHRTELVNTTLGKAIGNGIMPAYPFFILSIINTYETIAKPLNQEITSQGYCYQALIYMYLTKQGVKNDEIDTYINFLTEFAFFFYTKKKGEIAADEFNVFMSSYLNKYNLPIKQETLLSKLRQTQIIALDNCNNYFFCYQYLYYFFVAKHLAEHIKDNEETIDSIISNLHKDENAYIAIFISHHSRDAYVLKKITNNARCLFKQYNPATLSKEELGFFDEQVNVIVEAVLPRTTMTPEKERGDRLKLQDEAEQNNRGKKDKIAQEEKEDHLPKDLRRSVKTVEVMGSIIKNRAGSLGKSELESIFEEAMKVHLRILTSFFELIKDEGEQKKIVDYISDRIETVIENKAEERRQEGRKEKEHSKEEIEKMSRCLFWNLNFFVIYGFIGKIINSLGSNKLTAIIEKVCDNDNTPASFLVKHGILMWYNKNIQIDNIANEIDKDDFSGIATKVMKFMIVNHCSMHSIGFKGKQKIENKFKIPSKRLLIQEAKGNK